MIGAADFSARCASRAEATPEFGAAGNVEAMAIGKRFAEADGHPSTKLSTIEDRQRDGKTPRGRRPIGEGSSVTENPLAAFVKQKTYRRKKRSSRTTPLPNAFGAGNGFLANMGASDSSRRRTLSGCSTWTKPGRCYRTTGSTQINCRRRS